MTTGVPSQPLGQVLDSETSCGSLSPSSWGCSHPWLGGLGKSESFLLGSPKRKDFLGGSGQGDEGLASQFHQ